MQVFSTEKCLFPAPLLHGVYLNSLLLHVPFYKKAKKCKNFACLNTLFPDKVYLTTMEMLISGDATKLYSFPL